MPQMNTPPQQPQQRIWALRSLQVLLHLAPARLQFQRQPWAWKPGFCPHHLSWWRVWPVPSNYQLQRSPTYHLELQNEAVHWLIDGQEDKPSGKYKKFRLEDMGSPCPITTHNPTLLATSHQNQNITEQWRASFRCCGICALVLPLPWLSHHGWNTGLMAHIYLQTDPKTTHCRTWGVHELNPFWFLSTLPQPRSSKIRAISNRGSSVKILAGNCWHLLRLKRWASAITSKYLLPWA